MGLIIGILGRPKKSDINMTTFNKEVTDVIIMYGHIPLGIIPPVINIKEPMNEPDIEKLHKAIDLCDGIILQGGKDFYQYDLEAVKYIYQKNIPVLGICLGMQAIGAFFGGTLISIENHNYPGVDYVHPVGLKDNTLLRKIIGKQQLMVNSRHYHMITNPIGINIVGYNDNVIEAIEKSDALFLIGVQWHPESIINDESSKKIFNALFSACEIYHCHKT